MAHRLLAAALLAASLVLPGAAGAVCFDPGTECKGLFDETASSRKFAKQQRSLDPEPFFEPIMNLLNPRQVTICEKNDVPVGSENPTGKLRGSVNCGKRWKAAVAYWQKEGEAKRIEPPVETEEKITLEVELTVGTNWQGGLISAKAKVGAKWEYTVKYVTYTWECLYRPVIDHNDKEDAGDCGTTARLLTDKACVEP